MKVSQEQVLSLYPSLQMIMQPALRGLPLMMNLSGDCVVGNSSGFGNEVYLRALGEYVERYHFYNEVEVNLTSKMHHAESWKKLVQQIQISTLPFSEHEFDLTRVKNIFTNQNSLVPSACISLGKLNPHDRNFIPFVDSCGQASHVTAELAFAGALNEFLERQALIGSWLAGKAKFQIELHLPDNFIIKKLRQHGTLYAFDLANHLPGFAVIVFYFSNSSIDRVRYSVGMAASSNPNEAIESAVNELWQSYNFIYLNADNAENLDDRYQYLNELLNFNNHDTYDLIPYFINPAPLITTPAYCALSKYNKSTLYDELNLISPEVYTYQRSTQFFGRQFHFCKILSPDFFLHMGIQKQLNFDNHYARLLQIEKPNKIPFPIPFP